MLTFIARRLLALIPVFLGGTILLFTLMQLAPGEPKRTLPVGRQIAFNSGLLEDVFLALAKWSTLRILDSLRSGMWVLSESFAQPSCGKRPFSARTVPSSSADTSAEYPAMSAARMAARRRDVGGRSVTAVCLIYLLRRSSPLFSVPPSSEPSAQD